MKQTAKNNWYTLAIGILENDGFAKITIDNLCLSLQVTKGSFYHHFKNMDGYTNALMQYWLEENTLSFIGKAEQGKTAAEKYKILNELSVFASHKSEQSIRAWSYSNAIVKQYVDEVDKIRLNYLIKIRTEGGANPSTLRHEAMIDYATLIGIQQLYPLMTKDERKTMQKLFQAKFK